MSQYSSFNSSNIPKENTGSTEVQVSVLTERVLQLSNHLKVHNKDYSSQRGLRMILGKRKRLLAYISRKDAVRYERLINKLGIRGLKAR